ncbi:KilA-N domain-containing protein [Acetobacter orientalis]|uniref:KilA-N domain-containing protein n=1 Tax=Acetobacter orientalis TaxID=146474 RepID=UPI00386693C3
MTSTLAILNTQIRQDAQGRFCLNDCHRAAGGDAAKKPANFLRLDTTKALIAEISRCSDVSNGHDGACSDMSTPLNIVNDGKNNGTYACRELIYAYGEWISPAFHLTVIRAFDAMVTAQAPLFAVPKSLSAALRLAADQAELIEEMKPKIAAHAIITEAAGDLGVRDAGREVKLGQGWVTNTMLARKWACRQGRALRPAHYGLEMGYVRLCATPYTCRVTGETKVRDDIKVTRKGIDRLAQIIAQRKTKEMEAA